MIWHVTDQGRVEVRLRATGAEAIKVARVKADQYFANIASDLSVTQGVEVTTDELRYSFSKTRPEVTVIWRSRVPVEKVADVREYLSRLASSELSESESGPQTVAGEIVEPPDQ